MTDDTRKAIEHDLPLTEEAQMRQKYLWALNILISKGVTSEMVAHLPMASGAQVFILTEIPPESDGSQPGRRAVAVLPEGTIIDGRWNVNPEAHEVIVFWADAETIAYPTRAFRMNPTCKPLPT